MPNISAYVYMHGQHDYNKMSLMPMGCAALKHIEPEPKNHRISMQWTASFREHYQCFQIWIKETWIVWIVDTIFFKHQNTSVHEVTKAGATVVAAQQLTNILQNEVPNNISKMTKQQLNRLVGIIMEAAHKTMMYKQQQEAEVYLKANQKIHHKQGWEKKNQHHQWRKKKSAKCRCKKTPG